MAKSKRQNSDHVSTQITDVIAQHNASFNEEFKAMIDNIHYAYMAFTQCMDEGNEVYLEFCNHLLESALDVVQELTDMELEVFEDMQAELEEIKKSVSEKINTQGKKSAKSTSAAALTTKGKAVSAVATKANSAKAKAANNAMTNEALQNMQMAFAAKFMTNMLEMMTNLIHAQNQQMILGQSATTMGVMQIYSMDTVADAIAIAQMPKKKK